MAEAVGKKGKGEMHPGWILDAMDFKTYGEAIPLAAAEGLLNCMAELPYRLSHELISEMNHSAAYLSCLGQAQLEASSSLLADAGPKSWASASSAFAARALQLNADEFERRQQRVAQLAKAMSRLGPAAAPAEV